jgi:aromatase
MTTQDSTSKPLDGSDITSILVARTGADPALLEDGEGQLLEELGIDSLAVLELQAAVKTEFGLEIPEDALQMSVAEIVRHTNKGLAGE